MRFALATIAGSALLALGAVSASADQSEDDRLSEFRQTGETVNCLQSRQVRSIKPVDESRFLIEMRGGATYLNEVRSRCSGADRGFNYLHYRTSGTQICRGEIVSVRDQQNHFTLGSCAFGSFERLEPLEPAGA